MVFVKLIITNNLKQNIDEIMKKIQNNKNP